MMMTCRELYAFLDEFLDDRLDAETRRHFERHLDRCAACRRYLASYRSTVDVVRRAERLDTPAATDAPEALVRSVLEARFTSGRR